MIKLSFIVPFYNVEKYIGACLNSLYAQDIPEEEYEVICVDDCSPDNSKSIVRKYQKQHANLVLIEHPYNKGLGAARNTGMYAARGKYLWFVDSDDMVYSNVLSDVFSKFIVNNPDVILFNYERVNRTGELIDEGIVFEDSVCQSGRDFVKSYFGDGLIYHLGYVWRCVYRTEYLKKNNFVFPENSYWEDTVFFPKTILYADKVISLTKVFYKYRVNDDSISGKINKYKAERYYQFSFVAGKDLFDFSQEYMQVDKELASALKKKSIWYFNSFTKPLAFSTYYEKKRFYTILRQNKAQIAGIMNFISPRNKVLLIPFLGLLLSYLFRIAYSIKDRTK